MNLALTPEQFVKLSRRPERVHDARLLIAAHDALESRKLFVKECEKVLEDGRLRREREHCAHSENEVRLRRKAKLDPTDENLNNAKRAREEFDAVKHRHHVEASKEAGKLSNARGAFLSAERAKDRLRTVRNLDPEIFELKDGIYRLTAEAEQAFPRPT
jgi:hypothetical protein